VGRAVGGRRAALLAAALVACAAAAGAQPAYRVEDIATTGFTGSAPHGFTSMGGIVYFAARDAANGDELWRTDGTAAGTWLVRDLRPGVGDSMPAELTAVGDTLFLTAADSLWMSDGTEAGTVRLRPDLRSPLELVDAGGTLYFTAESSATGRELWRTDGTASGTVLVRDILPGPESSHPLGIVALGNEIYFAAIGAEGDELWRSDGTEAGTVLVRDVASGPGNSNPLEITPMGGRVYFSAFTPTEGRELWRSDGTEAGTTRLRDVHPGTADSLAHQFTAAGGSMYFVADDGVNGLEVWRAGGPGGATMIGPASSPGAAYWPSDLTDLGGVLFFTADDGVHGRELWRVEGTSATVLDLIPGSTGSSAGSLAAIAGRLYFGAVAPGSAPPNHFGEPWASDGTAAGSAVIKRLNGAPSASVVAPIEFGGALVFRTDDGVIGYEPWRSDGTAAGTYPLLDIHPGPNGSAFGDFASMNGALYFIAFDPTGPGLWRTDGTTAGTVRVAGLPGPHPFQLVAAGNNLFFTTNDGVNGEELWRSDGTQAGTVLLKDISPGLADSIPIFLTPSGSTLFFLAHDPFEGFELWKSDGTSAGTVRVRAIRPGPESSMPWDLTPHGSLLFFTADDGNYGRELWRSDGTEAGTMLVHDVAPGMLWSDPVTLFPHNADLYFVADDSMSGHELWRTDGSPAGTQMVRDIRPGPAGSFPNQFTTVAGRLLFSADDGATGREPWRSDGTLAGTARLLDLHPGPESSITGFTRPRNWGGWAFFAAAAATGGQELWRTDGTPEGTRLIQDIGPGAASAGFGEELTPAAGRLFFAAADQAGTELWALLPELSIADVTASEPSQATVTVSLVPAIDRELTVPFATTDGTAQGTFDYAPVAGILTFAPGMTTRSVDVTVLDDFIDEPDEDFFLDLSSPLPAFLADARGRIVVQDDDPTLSFSVADVDVTEGHTGEVSAAFMVTLSGANGLESTVEYDTALGTAGRLDISLLAGTLTFPPGVVSQFVYVPVHGDTLDEPDEFFFLRLSGPTAAVLGDAEGVARIRDDDGGTIRISALDRDADRRADLAAQPGPVADEDLYVFRNDPWSSYEVTVDGASGDLGDAGPLLEGVSADLSTVFPSSPIGTGPARSLRIDLGFSVPYHQYIRVRSAGCTTDCGPDDVYRIRVRETTGRIARFNETGGQRTLLILQNRQDRAVVAHASYWAQDGARLDGVEVSLAPRASAVIATPPFATGTSGSITVTHDGPLGALAGKAVALDPRTGLAFDTPLTTRTR
jgi:ELWxxDGT repeat protein